jgi:hypothetical protein
MERWLEQGFVSGVHNIGSVERMNDIEIELARNHLHPPASGNHRECEVTNVMTGWFMKKPMRRKSTVGERKTEEGPRVNRRADYKM